MDAAAELLKLAEGKFGKLTAAEKKLFRTAAKGEIADYSPRSKKPLDPANAAKWGPSRVLLADRIAWLCTDRQASQFVTHRGIHLRGARIDEELDLEAAKVLFRLYFEQCKFTADINFQQAQIVALYMPGTHTGSLAADTLKVEGGVFLCKGFKADGEVRMPGARIGGDFDCSGANFINTSARALSADRLRVNGGVFLRDGFRAEGEVRLLSVVVGGSLDCDNGQFISNTGKALRADRLKVEGSVFLRNGFKAEGAVRMPGTVIGASLSCINGLFINKQARALAADRLRVGGSVLLRGGFRAEGEVRLAGSRVGRSLDCDGGQFINKGGKALVLSGSGVKGNVFFSSGFKAEGEIRLLGAAVGGDLSCEKGQLLNKDGAALSAGGLRVEGNVLLRDGFKAQGTVSLVGATIGGCLALTEVDSPREITLDLRSAEIDTLYDDQDSWPQSKRLLLSGLEYQDISPADSSTRIEFLRLQDDFWPQPYEQLAKVLRDSGDSAGARDVLVAKNKDKADRTQLTRAEWFWYRLFGPLIGYGHKPWLALPLALMIVLSGWVIFKEGYSYGLVTPSSESAYSKSDARVQNPGQEGRRISENYPVFNSLVYSLDVFVPVVDLRQARYWLPNANRGSELLPTSSAVFCTGGLLVLWLWFEIVCGWVLTTLILAGLTGLVRT